MSAFCGYEQQDETDGAKANYDFPQINLIIILLFVGMTMSGKKRAGVVNLSQENMKTEHNTTANTQGFNCYSDIRPPPKKKKIKSFHTSRQGNGSHVFSR